jgi:flagellar motor component MotA
MTNSIPIFGLFLGIIVLGMLVAGSTIYVVLCVIEFLIVMAFAVVWFVFPLREAEPRYQTVNRITKTGERNT